MAHPLREYTEAPPQTAQVYDNESEGAVVHDTQSEGEDTEEAEADDSESDEEENPENLSEHIRVSPILFPVINTTDLCLRKG